jgi:hypothetical protein
LFDEILHDVHAASLTCIVKRTPTPLTWSVGITVQLRDEEGQYFKVTMECSMVERSVAMRVPAEWIAVVDQS